MIRAWAARIGLAFAIALLVIPLVVDEPFHLGLFQRLELSSLDYRFQFRGQNSHVRDSSSVVIVEITNESFKSISQSFPFPRTLYAHLVRNLKLAGARAVGIDLLFDSPDSHGVVEDSVFGAAIRETDFVVLSGKREQDADRYEQVNHDNSYGCLFFTDADSAIGLVNIRADIDGVYRLYNPYFLVRTSDSAEVPVPTLAFGILNKALGIRSMTAPVDRGDAFTYAGRTMPKYDAGSVLINFYGPNGTFKHIKFHDVLDDDTFQTSEELATGQDINTFSDPDFGYMHDGTFKDKIVLIGMTIPEYKDLFPVSIGRARVRGDNQMYGVEIHANVVENVLRNDFLTVQQPLAESCEVAFLVMLSFLWTSAIGVRFNKRHLIGETLSFVLVLLLIGVILGLALWLFVSHNYVLKVVSPIVAILAGYLGSTVRNLTNERKQRLLVKSMFSTYVNPTVVDELLANPDKLVLGGMRKELTVLFSDIQGFTTIAQTMDPVKLVGILNEYLDAMSELILQNDGTLDKYEGDAIMAFWGAPVPQEDHPLRACKSALAMRDALVSLNKEWAALGRPELHMRIGINTGDMVVGNMGSRGKFAYTVMGDSVNLGSRLEGANKEYRTSIMVSKRTYDFVKDQVVGRELDLLTVKGRTEPVGVYELWFMKGDDREAEAQRFLEAYSQGMTFYHRHDWTSAAGAFARALELRPDDYPSLLHRDRSVQFQQSGEGSDVVVLKEK
jgi:adenylate cyclase